MKNKIIFGVGGFILGLVTGGVVAYKYLNKQVHILVEEEVEHVKAYAKDQIEKLETELESLHPSAEINAEDGEIHGSHVSFEEDDESQYTGVVQKKPGTVLERADRMKQPFLITFEQFDEEMPHFDKIMLTYYAGDETFINEETDEVIEDIRSWVGDAYEYFGSNPEEPDVLYIRNYKRASDYELTRVPGRWNDYAQY